MQQNPIDLNLEQHIHLITNQLRQNELSPQDLENAFSLFNQVSLELAESYHQLEHIVEKLTDRLNLLLEALPGGVIVLDKDNIITEVNPAAKLLFSDEIIGINWEILSERLLVATSSPNEWDIDVNFQTPVVQRLSILSRILEDGGKILLIQNITENYLLQKKLERHKRLSSMGEMAAGLAHQLRTPLATALLYTANLAKPNLPEPERIKFAEKSLLRLRNLERLIQDMLLFVRGEENQNQEPVCCIQLLQEVQQTIEPQLNQAGIIFNQADLSLFDINKMMLMANKKALAGVFLNLLENAMNATPKEGQISLEFNYLEDSHTILIQISDTGSGIDAVTLERIFEPFFTTRRDGTGLGLAIVRSVVDAHNGEINVTSEKNKGSTFELKFKLI